MINKPSKAIILHHLIPLLIVLGVGIISGYFTSKALKKNPAEAIIIQEEEINDYYNLLKIMADELNRNNITYWLVGGSLIGSIRSRPAGPLKFDDDYDVGIFKKDEEKVRQLLSKHSTLVVSPFFFGLKADFEQSKSSFRIKNPGIWRCDFFSFTFFEEGIKGYGSGYYLDDIDARNTWPGSRFKFEDDILPLKICFLWDIEVRCASNSKLILKNEYGSDAFTKMKSWNHISEGDGTSVDLADSQNRYNLLPMMSKQLIEKLFFSTSKPLLNFEEF